MLYAVASGLWTEAGLDWLDAIWKLALLAGVFCIGATLASTERVLKAMALGILVMLPLVIAQKFNWISMLQVASPAGLFINRNILAELCAVLLVAMVYKKAAWLIPAPALCLILAPARSTLVALGITFMVMLFTTLKISRVKKAALGLVLVVGFSTALVVETQNRGLPLANLVQNERVLMWRDVLAGVTAAGHGLGSFWVVAPKYSNLLDPLQHRSEYAHNEPLHFLFELGAGSLVFIALLYLCWRGRRGRELEAFVLLTLLGESLFSFPFHMPTTGFILALVAGCLCANESALRGVHVAGRDNSDARAKQTLTRSGSYA